MHGWCTFGTYIGRIFSKTQRPNNLDVGLRCVYWSVSRWHAAWQERCQALERLRICISRKRISFRLFKQWYWESFDDDVQVRLLPLTALLYSLMLCPKNRA